MILGDMRHRNLTWGYFLSSRAELRTSLWNLEEGEVRECCGAKLVQVKQDVGQRWRCWRCWLTLLLAGVWDMVWDMVVAIRPGYIQVCTQNLDFVLRIYDLYDHYDPKLAVVGWLVSQLLQCYLYISLQYLSSMYGHLARVYSLVQMISLAHVLALARVLLPVNACMEQHNLTKDIRYLSINVFYA